MTRSLFCILSICISSISIQAQNASIQDCIGAIPICQPVYVESQSPEGKGNIDEVNPDFNCMQVESNSIWYTFTVNNSGNFGFLLTPQNIADDYDWALFNLTNASCADLYDDPSLIVSCNAAGGGSCDGITGANGNSSFNVQGAGCDANFPNFEFGRTPYNALIPVKAGNIYALVVSNWTGSTNGYKIDFGLSDDIGIFDQEAPYLKRAELSNSCDGSSLDVDLSEFVQCATVDVGDFQLEGPGGSYELVLTSTDCINGANFGQQFKLGVSPTMIDTGTYTLKVIADRGNEIMDLCENPITAQEYTLVLDALDVPVDLGEDVTFLCAGEILDLEVGALGAKVLWQDGSSENIRSFNVEGTYYASVTTACGTNSDTVALGYVSRAPEIDLGSDLYACPGEEFVLVADGEEASYLWQDNSTEPTFTLTQTGDYSVTVTNACGVATDGMRAEYQAPLQIDLGRDTFLCGEEVLNISINSNAIGYLWQDGSTLPNYTIREPGTYILEAFNECQTVIDTLVIKPCQICDMRAPNIFSPNADGKNDRLQFFANCEILSFELKIFSRWGDLLFESRDPSQTWDGNFRGEASPGGVYVWVVAWETLENGIPKSLTQTGNVTLIR